MIYLIQKMQLDPLENDSDQAAFYQTCGYVHTHEEAKYITDNCRLLTRKDCWAISEKGEREYRYTSVMPFDKGLFVHAD